MIGVFEPLRECRTFILMHSATRSRTSGRPPGAERTTLRASLDGGPGRCYSGMHHRSLTSERSPRTGGAESQRPDLGSQI